MTRSSDRIVAPSPLLPSTCLVTTRADSIYTDKGDGTQVNYYLFDEYEIHANVIAAGTVQGWHHHDRIIETLYVTSGSIEARWLEDGQVTTRRLDRGDIITVGSSVHTFANPYAEAAEFLVFRLVPDGTDKRDVIKNDRHADEPPPAS
jgi:mannose-6-phosphate isomerase-like protein (cupin superfamily)